MIINGILTRPMGSTENRYYCLQLYKKKQMCRIIYDTQKNLFALQEGKTWESHFT